MGMDFKYQGSASYPRFEKELYAIAEVFGGMKTEHLKNREATEGERSLGHWFGSYSSDQSDAQKFAFPDGTNKTLVKWFNYIYGFFTRKETLTVWKAFLDHPEIEEISPQIWNELKTSVEVGDTWSINL